MTLPVPACLGGMQTLSPCADQQGGSFTFLSWSQVQVQAGEELACLFQEVLVRVRHVPSSGVGTRGGNAQRCFFFFFLGRDLSPDLLCKTQSEEK